MSTITGTKVYTKTKDKIENISKNAVTFTSVNCDGEEINWLFENSESFAKAVVEGIDIPDGIDIIKDFKVHLTEGNDGCHMGFSKAKTFNDILNCIVFKKKSEAPSREDSKKQLTEDKKAIAEGRKPSEEYGKCIWYVL